MNFKELIDTFIIDLGEENDADVIELSKRFINRAYKELGKREGLVKTLSLSVVDNAIPIPSDYVRAEKVELNGEQIQYSQEENKLLIGSNGDVKLFYYYLPTNLVNDEDIPITNAANEEFILNFAKYLYLLSEEEDIERANFFKNECENFNIFRPIRTLNIINVYEGMW